MRNLLRNLVETPRLACVAAFVLAILPLTGWLAAALVCVITLRFGLKAGATTLALAMLSSIAVGFGLGQPSATLWHIAAGLLLPWGLAILLRFSRSWMLVIESASMLGLAGVMVFHALVGNVSQFWHAELLQQAHSLQQLTGSGISSQELTALVMPVADYFAGIQVALLLFSSFSTLVVARGIQAYLYNPGGLRRELLQLRASQLAVGLLLVVALGFAASLPVAKDALTVAALPLLLAGLSMAHLTLTQSKGQRGLRFGVFYGLFFVFFKLVALVLMLLATLDATLNLRKRLNQAMH